VRTALPDDNAVQPHIIFLQEQKKEVHVNDNLIAFFEKASADKELKDRIITLYREYSTKEEIISRLIILASEYGIILTPDDFRKKAKSYNEYEKRSDSGNTVIADSTTAQNTDKQKTPAQNRCIFRKLFNRKQ